MHAKIAGIVNKVCCLLLLVFLDRVLFLDGKLQAVKRAVNVTTVKDYIQNSGGFV